MALPFVFANVNVLQTPQLDSVYNALGVLTIIPCTATGTNTIALTPAANTPTISAYSNLTPVFAFLAAASASGAVTVNINGIGAKNLYKNNGATAAGSGDIVSGGLYLISYNSALNGAVGGFVLDNPSASAFLSPTRTTLITGSGTYTSPAGVVRIFVRFIGGGGGGGASATNTGSTGGTTTFNSVNAIGGSGGVQANGAGGVGGTGGTGTALLRLPGAPGGHTPSNSIGGQGASGLLGSSGGQPGAGIAAGGAAAANTGAGGGGGSNAGTGAGSGGGAGEYVELAYLAAGSYSYSVGAGGAGGIAGTQVGGNGGSGIILVDEYYF